MLSYNLIEVNDVYYISKLIKNINSNFKIFYNLDKNVYEVHDTKQKNSFIISYNTYPDINLIKKLYITDKNNMKKLFLEIEENNKKLEFQQEQKLIDTSKQMINEIFHFQSSNPSNVLSPNKIKNILEKGD